MPQSNEREFDKFVSQKHKIQRWTGC